MLQAWRCAFRALRLTRHVLDPRQLAAALRLALPFLVRLLSALRLSPRLSTVLVFSRFEVLFPLVFAIASSCVK